MSGNLEEMLTKATALKQSGDDAAAERCYRAVLAQFPTHAEANHNLGLLLTKRGRAMEGLSLFQMALKSEPTVARYWLSYAKGLVAIGHPREAHMVLARAQERGLAVSAIKKFLGEIRSAQPSVEAELLVYSGTAHAEQGRVAQAIAAWREALAIAPDLAEAHFRLGSILSENGDIAEGFAHYMRRAAIVHGAGGMQTDKPPPAHRTKHDHEQVQYFATKLGGDAPSVHLEDGARLPGPAVNPANATTDLERQWRVSHPKMVVIDNFLVPLALAKLRAYCAGSTIWHRNYDAGYIGATLEDGLACPLMAQVAEEVASTYSGLIGQHAFRYLGAFKYDSTLSTGTNTHADNSAVNVNLYITPDDANLDPNTGGMDIWDVRAPPGDEMRRYNANEVLARDYLARTGARLTSIPHRANRAVIFQSDLFHKTSDCRFKEGYLNKRINVSLLFGDRPA